MKKNILNKKFWLFILFLIIISVFWIFSKKRSENIQPTPTPKVVVFDLLKTVPKNGINTELVPTTAIEFVFNKSINPNSLSVQVDPQTNFTFDISENRRSVFVRTIPYWETNKNYTIILNTQSEEGESLRQEIKYNLFIIEQKESNLVEKFQ